MKIARLTTENIANATENSQQHRKTSELNLNDKTFVLEVQAHGQKTKDIHQFSLCSW